MSFAFRSSALAVAGLLALSACSSSKSSTSGSSASQPSSTAATVPSTTSGNSSSGSAGSSASPGGSSAASTTTTAGTSTSSSTATSAGSAASAKVDANNASQSEVQAALQAAGVSNPDRWANEVVEYRPYPTNDPSFAKLKQNLAKYNPSPAVVDGIISALRL